MQKTALAALFFTAAMVASCGDEAREPVCLMPDTTVVRPGDIVFRRGGGFTSHAVVTLDAHGYYSHVGMVVDTAGRMMVVHAVPGEPDFEGDPDRVKLDSLQKFFSSLYTDCGEVCRVSDAKVAGKAAEVAKQVLRRNTLFDHDYRNDDSTQMYCTELVLYAYRKAGLRLTDKEPHYVELPLLKSSVYYPSDVYFSKKIHSITKF